MDFFIKTKKQQPVFFTEKKKKNCFFLKKNKTKLSFFFECLGDFKHCFVCLDASTNEQVCCGRPNKLTLKKCYNLK